MNIILGRFNIILMATLILVAMGVIGCAHNKGASGRNDSAPKPKKSMWKDATQISFHVEMNPDGSDRCVQAKIYRNNPITLVVDRSPVLHEGFIERADVIDFMGTYAIRIKFDRTGTLLLDNVTTSNKGRHLAIFCYFTDARWIGAPLITQRISDGVFVFTPDATRDETERIVRGLNNVAKAIQPKKKG
ncbi:MAG: SecDF P1 head subdomain-containing protein [Verrucomicrobiia bacterium]